MGGNLRRRRKGVFRRDGGGLGRGAHFGRGRGAGRGFGDGGFPAFVAAAGGRLNVARPHRRLGGVGIVNIGAGADARAFHGGRASNIIKKRSPAISWRRRWTATFPKGKKKVTNSFPFTSRLPGVSGWRLGKVHYQYPGVDGGAAPCMLCKNAGGICAKVFSSRSAEEFLGRSGPANLGSRPKRRQFAAQAGAREPCGSGDSPPNRSYLALERQRHARPVSTPRTVMSRKQNRRIACAAFSGSRQLSFSKPAPPPPRRGSP